MADITVDIVVEDLDVFVSTQNFTAHSVVVDDLDTHQEFMPSWLSTGLAVENAVFLTADRIGTISGTVKIQGVLQNKARVLLYFRKTGQLIQQTFTDANGGFSFQCGLDRNVSDYFAIALTEQPYNAQIFDKITPA